MIFVDILAQPITRSPSIGEVFGVRSIDGSFNRGQIIEILNENQFKVIFFDFGTEEIVSANSIIEISEQLKQVIFICNILTLLKYFNVFLYISLKIFIYNIAHLSIAYL